jgi:hypothetical protein
MDFRRIPKTHASLHNGFDYYVGDEASFYHFVGEFNLTGVHWGEPQTISSSYFLRLLTVGSSARAHGRGRRGRANEADESSTALRKYYTPLRLPVQSMYFTAE